MCAFNKSGDLCFNKDIALEGTTVIANLEAERDARLLTITTYTTEITQLHQTLLQNEAFLNELKRGHHIAEAANQTQKLRVSGIDGLRVADCSVMHALVSGNTNASTMTIAGRAADFILSG